MCSSLDPAELGCTHSTEPTIKVTHDTPFKEWFRCIPPLAGWWGSEPPVGDAGVRHYLAQPECLVQCSGVGKEEGSWPMFLHWFWLPECLHKEGLLPVLENLIGTGHFSCLDVKLGFWQIKMRMRHQSSTLPSQKVFWGFSNAIACPLGSVMHWQHSNGLCRIDWAS